jgi:hypothetical protein
MNSIAAPTGSAAIFSVPATPWHREGTILNEAPSLAAALSLGGLDFEVDVRPPYTRTPATPELPDVFTHERAADAFGTVTTDRESVLGVVSGRYRPAPEPARLSVSWSRCSTPGSRRSRLAARCEADATSACSSASTSIPRMFAKSSRTRYYPSG